jgi:hypothetical protein
MTWLTWANWDTILAVLWGACAVGAAVEYRRWMKGYEVTYRSYDNPLDWKKGDEE